MAMLSRLHLTNFRRHENTAVDFDGDARLILIEGPNGAGKSTLVEAILWALYGEGREGRANLDALVRRGAEDEGMQVEVTFERGGRPHRVVRSRRQGHSKARLEVDGIELARSPSSVTAEVTRLFGVDAAGFRLAVYAQQKELDALASLQPARRSAMLGRLIGIDAVAAARNDAAAAARTARTILDSLRSDQVDQVKHTCETARAALEAAQAEEAELTTRVDELTSVLAALKVDEDRYQQAYRAHLAAVGARDQVTARAQQIDADLATLEDLTELPGGDVDRLTDETLELHRQLQRAESDHELWRQRPQVEQERDLVHRQLLTTIEQVDRARNAAAQSESLDSPIETLQAEVARLTQEQRDAADRISRLQQQLEDARDAASSAEGLAGACDTCGQQIDGEHLAQLTTSRADTVTRIDSELSDARRTGGGVQQMLRRQTEALGRTLDQQRELRTLTIQVDDLTTKEQELVTRRNQLDANLQRRPSSEPDVTGLHTQVGDADEALRQARQRREHNDQVRRRRDRREQLEAEREQLAAELARLDGTQIPKRLAQAHIHHGKTSAALREAENAQHEARTCRAVAAERAASSTAALTQAEQQRDERRKLTAQIQTATDAAKILATVADTLAARLRPALEGEVSQLLDRMSEGRYSQVRFDEDFNCEVADDGTFQPLSSLSGGEVDLVALAVRLALGTIVAERADASGPEFLILDECFGSQDASRQQSILTALRQLNDTYRQVLVISHVPGVRDSVDRVIPIVVDTDGEKRTAALG